MATFDLAERRKRYLARNAAIKGERSSWETLWKDAADYIHPQRSQFSLSEFNRPQPRAKMINSTPLRALQTMASGMMAGVTSKARPWFRLIPGDPSTDATSPGAKRYLHQVEEVLRLMFARSNFYEGMHAAYMDLGQFCTTSVQMSADPLDVLRMYHYPVGSYAIATSERGVVDTIYRELVYTVAQVVEKFGLEACSHVVTEAYNKGHLEQRIEILHAVEPNRKFREGMLGPTGKRWASVWLELNAPEGTGLLRESGFDEFPVLAPRWDVIGGNAYGYGPGMNVLEDAKTVQQVERRLLQLSDKISAPPVGVNATSMSRQVSLHAGAVNYIDGPPGTTIEPVFNPDPKSVDALGMQIERHERRIMSGFFADLWISMLEVDRGNMTATEVAERHDEKMMQLGPVMQRLEDELLGPAIDRAYNLAARVPGLLPKPPPELEGKKFRVEYISVVAQAQKLLGTAAQERFIAYVGQASQLAPQILDVPDWDKQVRQYADAVGLPPDQLLSDDAVKKTRQAKMQQQQQAQQMEQAQAATQTAKTLADTPLGGDTALQRLIDGYGGAAI